MRKTRSDKGVPRGARSDTDSRVYAFRFYSGAARDWFDEQAELIVQERQIPFSSAVRELILQLIAYAAPHIQIQPVVGQGADDLRAQLDELRDAFYQYVEQNKHRSGMPAAFGEAPVVQDYADDLVGDDLIDNILSGMDR